MSPDSRRPSDLPPVPPVRWRPRRLPDQLAFELRRWPRRRWRALRRQLRRPRRPFKALRRARRRTDPNYRKRLFAELGLHTSPWSTTPPPPPPGTRASVTGVLDSGQLVWGDLLIDGVSVDDAIADALGVHPTMSGFPVRITVEVLPDHEPDSRTRKASDDV